MIDLHLRKEIHNRMVMKLLGGQRMHEMEIPDNLVKLKTNT